MPTLSCLKPAFISAADLGREMGCTGQAIRNAIQRGDLNAFQTGGRWFVMRDKKLGAFEVKETGGRTHKSYIESQNG